MQLADIVSIEGIGPCNIRHPLCAIVIGTEGGDRLLRVVTGGYNATGSWCGAGHRFTLPVEPRNPGSAWRVLDADEVPDEVCVELAKAALGPDPSQPHLTQPIEGRHIMGDRTWTSIRFSGEITLGTAEGLLKEMNDYSLRCDEGPETRGDNLTIEHLMLDQYFYGDEVNYGMLESLEAYCTEFGIAYLKTWEPGGGYGPGMDLFDGHELHSCSTVEGEVAVTRSTLTELGTGILEFFDRFDFSDPKYPPLTIVDAAAKREAA